MEPPPGRATLRSFRGVVRHQTAHCLEAALAAAVILEQHGFPPLVLSFESIDRAGPRDLRRTDGRADGDRSRDRAIRACMAESPSLRRRARWRSAMSIRTSTSPAGSPAMRVVDLRTAGRLRLAAFRSQRLESRAHAPRLSAPGDRHVRRAHRPPAARYVEYTCDGSDSKPVYYRRTDRWTASSGQFAECRKRGR